jgi:hypothetical protein
MPFASQAQRSWMYAKKPAMAKRWAAETPKGKLPIKKKGLRRRSVSESMSELGAGG